MRIKIYNKTMTRTGKEMPLHMSAYLIVECTSRELCKAYARQVPANRRCAIRLHSLRVGVASSILRSFVAQAECSSHSVSRTFGSGLEEDDKSTARA